MKRNDKLEATELFMPQTPAQGFGLPWAISFPILMNHVTDVAM